MSDTVEADPRHSMRAIDPAVVEVDGLALRFVRGGRRDGAPLILLSPWPESIYAFEQLWGMLCDRYALTAVDLPGFGGSEGRADLFEPATMGGMIVRIVEALGLSRPWVVGPDIGTSALLFAAADHPDAFAGIVVGSGGASYPLDVAGTLADIIVAPSAEIFESLDVADLIDGVLAGMETHRVPSWIRDDYVASYAGRRFAASTAYVRTYPKSLDALRHRLPDVAIPVLVIAGRADPYVPVANAVYLDERLPRVSLIVLETGHLVWEEDPAGYGRALIDWMEHSATPPGAPR